MPMGKHRGFSLIELLIVVAIILIIAAIAIPNLLQARLSANEASAVGSIQAIKTAEIGYFNAYPNTGYANTLPVLGGANPCVPVPAAACLLDDFLATAAPGSGGKSGYVFSALGVASAGLNVGFVIGAAPVTVQKTGNRSFCSIEDGVLRFQFVGGMPVTTSAGCTAFTVWN
jgi:type IV pilus assembly protein PilA